ncbi:MAG: TetR/AcrR family transcriptional regulator [Bifidobacteriaceae bacterium]|nr:TetR/AcrR family transcriptional regulator [Bifidobacteriaceae bacterium]
MATAKRIPATDKLRQAFWELLEQRSYTDITVKDIIARARINRSAFYYHYADLKDLAIDAITAEYCADEDGDWLISVIASGNITAIAEHLEKTTTSAFLEHVHRQALIAGPHGTAELTKILRERIALIWLSSLGLSRNQLDAGQRMVLHFAIGGIVNSLGDIEQLIREGYTEDLQHKVVKMIAYTLKMLRQKLTKPATKTQTMVSRAVASTTNETGTAAAAELTE